LGFSSLELSQTPVRPGQGLAFRATIDAGVTISASLSARPFSPFIRDDRLVALTATGAFFTPADLPLTIVPSGQPLWSQPWRMVAGVWDYQNLTLTGAAAAIDAESIAQERERLFTIWSVESAEPLWSAPWELPIRDFLEVSSTYGGRRSYNGGPYRTYHEGVDFSAYGGTPVYAPGGGVVVLAETLYVRGGAVIIDHGLGIFTGVYHMSSVLATVGQRVAVGDAIGAVGTTGLSTGNHLHWDLLVGETWVDAWAWREQDMACWILVGLGQECQPASQAGPGP
jgi:hypothetical protein